MMRLMLTCCLVAISSSMTIKNQSSISAGKIVNGLTASTAQFPYQVSLRSGQVQSHFCGGFIITENWLGTAAHCVRGRSPNSVISVVGAIARVFEGTTYRLLKFVMHPDYNNSEMRNDIALIKTAKKIVFTSKIQPIKLRASYIVDGAKGVALGWGYTSNPGEVSSNLQYLNVKIIGTEECKSKMSKINAAKVFNSSICAVPVETGGACMGDSGGPLVTNIDGLAAVVGIISWGVPCNRNFPDVYTRIGLYQTWIDTVIDF